MRQTVRTRSKLKLRSLLGQLGIKSAQISALEDALLRGMESIASDFGRANQLFVNPHDYQQIQKLTKEKK